MKKLLLPLFFSFLVHILVAQEFDVFHLAIGSEHYENDFFNDDPDGFFSPIPGANLSARYTHSLLQDFAGSTGTLITSTASQKITRRQVLDQVKALIERAKSSGAEHPLLIFYFCGHGISEGVAWNQFMVPGDLDEKPQNLSTDPNALDLEAFSERLIYLREITDLLEESGMLYFCMIDTCYEGAEEDFMIMERFMPEAAVESLRNIAGIIKYMNEYNTANPVVFATPPGTTVSAVENPVEPDRARVGSIARKLQLVSRKLEELERLTLLDTIMLLTNAEFDPLTPTVLSNYKFDDKGFYTLFREKE